MSFRTLCECIPSKQYKINNMLKKAEKLHLTTMDDNEYYLKICSIIEQLMVVKNPNDVTPNVITLSTTINYNSKFVTFNKTGICHFDETELMSQSYNDSQEFEEQYLFYKILQAIKKRQIIFIFMDLVNYTIDHFDDDTKEYVHHSVCGILNPIQNKTGNTQKSYDFLYFNSHGNATKEYHFYNMLLSKRRNKRISLPCELDYFINTNFIHSLNEYLYMYGENTYINYDTTMKYNYQHVNLQCGDNYGLCFIFPFIIWYNIINKFNNIYKLKNTHKQISSSYQLLENKELFQFINKAFIIYDTQFEDLIVETFIHTITTHKASKVIESFIERKGTLFLKKIIGAIVSFVGQKNIKDKLFI